MLNVGLLTDKNNPPDQSVHDTGKKDIDFEWIYILWVFLGIVGLGLMYWGIEWAFSIWKNYQKEQEKRRTTIYY